MRDRSPPEYRATVVGLRVGEPTVRCWLLAAMLDDVGFTDIATQPTAADRTVIVAHKSS